LGNVVPVDYQEFHGNTSTKLLKLWQMNTRNCFWKDGFVLNEMGKVELLHLSRWTCSPRNARYLSGGNITLQGILIHQDCCQFLIKKMVHEMIDEFGKDKYIVNLGHGITKYPVDHAKAFVDAVKEYTCC
jgi:uroporphyrinogen decarboxylase